MGINTDDDISLICHHGHGDSLPEEPVVGAGLEGTVRQDCDESHRANGGHASDQANARRPRPVPATTSGQITGKASEEPVRYRVTPVTTNTKPADQPNQIGGPKPHSP